MTDALVLVLNAGSSSLRYQILRLPSGERVLRGHLERIDPPGFATALGVVAAAVEEAGCRDRLTAVGHRVVHGGTRYSGPALVDDVLLAAVDELSTLAPLHNPPAVAGMRNALATYRGVPHVAVFDTAFFSDLPEVATTVAIDHRVTKEHQIRRYGMHGTSHEYVTHRAAEVLQRDVRDLDQIVLHLGNGASAAAVRGGRPVETSMGYTPLEGLVMGTRGGDLDPGVLLHLLRHEGYDVDRLDDLLQHHSGLRGLTGTADFRDLLRSVDEGHQPARVAVEVYCHRIRKYVGAYLAVLDGADAVTFTGGVGENVPRVRETALSGLDRLGIQVDPQRNKQTGGPRIISTPASRVKVLVVPTDEELAIARKTLDLVGKR